MKHLCLFGLILSLPFFGFSQGEFNIWNFGVWASVSFNSGAPQNQSASGMFENPGIVGCSVSDSAGNILFYSDGSQVLDRTKSIMPNGSGLLSGPNYHQSAFAVQDLVNKNQYYLFTVGAPLDEFYQIIVGLHYSVIDMTLHGGLGDIIPGQKNIPVIKADSAVSQITGIRHSNNKYAWVVVLNQGHTTNYQSYLIDSSGFHTTPVSSPSNFQAHINVKHASTNMRISPDGKHLVCTDSLTQLCYFNDTTGVVTPRFIFHPYIGGFDVAYGKEFSINSHYLYVTAQSDSAIYQYDMSSPDSLSFVQSKQKIGFVCNYNIQMAPDGKIYINNYTSQTWLGVINNPSIGGSGCNYNKNGFQLINNHNGCLPQFLQRYKVYVHDSGVCQNNPVYFSGDIWPPPDSVHWNFGDPSSGSSNFSNLLTPTHSYSSTGNFTIVLFVRHNDNRTDTAWKTITIISSPQVSLGPNRTICIGDSTTFDAGFCIGCTYQWKNLGTGLPVGSNQTFKTGLAGTYSVTVTNPNACIGWDTVQLITTPIPVITNNPLSKSICSGESTNVPLTSTVPGTNFHWTATVTSGNITGFSADSGLVINQILTNTLATPGIVTYQITPKIGSCIGTTVNYQVTVNPGDSVKVDITASANNICAGTPVTFTAHPTNPGATPVYQWKVNGINSGTNSDTFNYTPLNNDVVTCQLTSSNIICTYNNPATSNPIVMVVNPISPVSVSITTSQNPVCSGNPVTFTATPTHGGITPSYQWKVNGINVGINSPNYTCIPVNNDQVYCILTSSELCTSGNPASSNTITMVVNVSLPASVSITPSSNPFCPGNSVNFTATPINGGTPVYQWKVNGINVGTNSITYSYNPVNNDSVRCIMTSNLACVTGNPASSNKIIMSGTLAPIVTFTSCFDTITTTNAKPIKLKGGIPLGGTYSGSGVSAGYYYPNIAGTGTHVITYSYTNVSLCTASNNSRIHQFASSPVNCGSQITDIRDNKIYQTVQIGAQCWLATNLNFGTTIASTQDQRDNCISEKYCYNDNPLNCTNQGGLYQWDEVMRFDETPASQGFCPPAWHIPTENEWNTLFANWTNNGFAGSPLKYSGYSGFNALLSGARHINRGWDFQGFATFFWSSTTRSNDKAWAHGMNDPDPSVSVYPASRVNAFSVRCLKD